MEFSVLQAEKIDLLENKCSESAKQIAYMCNQCTEQYKSDLTEEVLIKEEELELRSFTR